MTMLYGFLALALAALDQLVKYLVRTHIPLHQSVPFLPGIMDLTYVRNTGGAFSALSGATWLLTLISAVMVAVFAVLLVRRWPRHPLGRIPLAMVAGGAAGNLIDRLLLGYVVDMFQTTFMDFAVFNVADICIVVGGIWFCLYYILLHEKVQGGGEDHGQDPAPEN